MLYLHQDFDLMGTENFWQLKYNLLKKLTKNIWRVIIQ